MAVEDATVETEGEAVAPKESKYWLALIQASQKAFNDYNTKSDNIDKLYADLMRLANTTREREMQLFWANVQVLGPSIYSRPPIPVVTTRFKDRRPLARTAAEVLERASIVAIEQEDINAVMLDLRNDMTTVARGVPWVRLGEKDGKPCVYIDHLNRRDFLHDPARTWKENDWVDKCSWLTRGEARKRFFKTSGNAYKDAGYVKLKRTEGTGYDETDTRLKAPFHELWSKSANRVVWVAEGVEVVLDEGPPHLKLEGFFPCPPPAYGTVQRNTLIPVPDVLFYKDQLEEINELTGRIGALTESLKLKGFYPAGAGKLSDAIEAAVKASNNNQVLVPVSDWAMLGTGAPKDMIVWLPVDMVAKVISELINLRKQLIDDVYQITGLSDIMRGSTVASETLGAQELKSQYGSVRIRDKQAELVRVARDTIRITAEIIAENYTQEQIAEMSQMDLPTTKQILAQIAQLEQQGKQIEAQIAQAQQDPKIMAMAQQNPDQAQALLEQAQGQLQAITGQIEKLGETVTIDAVVKFLRDNRMRSFMLEIETDSTIQPDEDRAKQRANEYITSMGGLLQQAVPIMTEAPQMANVVSEIISFANKQFRVGRTMETAVEEFADQMKQMASQPKPDPNAAAQQAEQVKQQQAHDQIMAKQQADQQAQAAEAQNKQLELQNESQRDAAKAQADGIEAQQKHELALSQQQIDATLAQQKLAEEAALKATKQAHELQMTEIQTYADIGLKAQKELMNAEQAAQKEAEKLDGETKAQDKDKKTANDLSELGKTVLKMGESVVAAAAMKRQVTMPDGRVITSEAVQ